MRGAAVSVVATAAALLGAWGVWEFSPRLIAVAGLQRYDLLLRVLIVFAALGLAERVLAWLGRRWGGPEDAGGH